MAGNCTRVCMVTVELVFTVAVVSVDNGVVSLPAGNAEVDVTDG